MTTWRKEIQLEQTKHGDDILLASTLTEAELDEEFDNGYGYEGIRGRPFTAWSSRRVYFPICHDGASWVGSAPRNPCDEATDHMGGG